jgi:sugar phosphate isomerase/epimerase
LRGASRADTRKGMKVDGGRRRFFDLGVVQYASFPQVIAGTGPVAETIERVLADEFFSAIEITWIEDERVKQQVANLLSQAGMRVVFAGGPPYAMQRIHLSALDEAERRESLRKAKRLVDDAYLVGAELHLITAGPDVAPEDRGRARGYLTESMVALSEYARSLASERALVLALEPTDRDVHRNGLLGPTEEAVEVLNEVRRQGGEVWLTLDQSHLAQLGETAEDSIALAQGFHVHTHLANCLLSDRKSPIYGDEHPRFGVAGGEHGVREVIALFETLWSNGFFQKTIPYGERPIISVEVKPQDHEDQEIVLANSKRVVENAWARARTGLVGDKQRDVSGGTERES